jgi:hypothetical protein
MTSQRGVIGKLVGGLWLLAGTWIRRGIISRSLFTQTMENLETKSSTSRIPKQPSIHKILLPPYAES